MSIFRFTKTITADLNYIDSVEIIQMKNSKFLNLLDFETGNNSKEIDFHKKQRIIQGGQRNKIDIFSEGNILFSIENNLLIVNWKVKLDALYFFSILLSSLIGFFANKSPKIDLLYSILIGLTVCIITVLIGIAKISLKVNEVNKTCLRKDYN